MHLSKEIKVSRCLSSSLGAALALALSVVPQSIFAATNSWQAYVEKGDANISHGDLNIAEASFRSALRQIKLGKHSTDQLAECQNKLANALALEGKTEEAESVYKTTLAQLEQSYGKGSKKLTPTLLALGSFFEAEGDHGTAMSLYQHAININEKSYNQYSPAISEILHHAGSKLPATGVAPYRPGATSLSQQPSLASSSRMLKTLSPAKDLVTKEDNSNQDLIVDFQNQMRNVISANAKRANRTAALQPNSRSSTD
jgi:tetratricopeptide (TPR) repeat protein